MDSLIRSYKAIIIPTFILWGTKDRIVPLKLGKRLHSEIPSSTMEILDNCGHIPQEEFPEETVKHLTNIFRRGTDMNRAGVRDIHCDRRSRAALD